MICWKNSLTAAPGYFSGGTVMRIVRTFRGSKPGSTFWILAKLRTKRPAPTSSITDSAISATMSEWRRRSGTRPAVAPRPSLFSASCGLVRVDWNTGSRATSTAEPIANIAAHPSTLKLIVAVTPSVLSCVGTTLTSAGRPTWASSKPAPSPAIASSATSASR